MAAGMTKDEALGIFTQIAVAFHEIHSKDVMHKNVHSDHFILKDQVGAEKQLKVIGFG